MKKSAKPIIIFGIIIFITLALLTLAYVSLKLESELLTKQKVLAEEELNIKKNKYINLVAQEQYLSSEERIVEIAQTELGMIKRNYPPAVITVSKEKIDQIENAIDKKYE